MSRSLPTAQLPDAPAREAIAADLGRSFFVEAGAGAGKTDRLVARVVAMVEAGIPLERIAAITFTEKAAAELRHRIREALTGSSRPDAAAQVEHAAIGTLHAFAQRVLQEFPVEAGLPPVFTVLDEVASDLAFTHRWQAFLDDLLADDDRARLVLLCQLDSLAPDPHLLQVAEAFGDNWDLVDERVDLCVPTPTEIDIGPLATALADLLATTNPPPTDSVVERLAELRQVSDTLRALQPPDGSPLTTASDAGLDVLDVVWAIADWKSANRIGSQAKWRSTPAGVGGLLAFREAHDAIRALAGDIRDRVREERRLLIGAEVGRFTLEAAQERRRLGTLEFHDLLVLARHVVRTDVEVRRRLHERYQRLLLDEFQDTDPIQLELAVLLAAHPDDPGSTWTERRPLPGRLFVVGDPKQSIYRFRRADIAQYLGARDHLPASVLTLSANFRTAEPVVSWVNHVFSQLICADGAVQPGYVPLDAVRRPGHGGVVLLGAEAHAERLDAAALRAAEAAELASAVVTAVADAWPVEDRTGVRPCRWGDIAVLLPARTALPWLEAAFTARDIPYRTENSSLVYAADEVRSLLLCLRALDDPTDELALVSSLRSALFGCSDADLYRWHGRGGRWARSAPRPPRLPDDPVAEAFDELDALTALAATATVAVVLEQLVERRRVFEAALVEGSPRDQWRRLRFLLDQARAWGEAGGAGIRGFLDWTARQSAEGRYVADVVLPESDHDAVRVMTVHAAKGLEFPVVMLAGLTTQPQTRRGVSVVWPPQGSWDVALPSGRSGPIYEAFKPLDEQMDHAERLRLLYVACTRARDHLVVSLHRSSRAPDAPAEKRTSAELLATVTASAPAQTPLVPTVAALPAPAATEASAPPWDDHDTWAAELDRAVQSTRRPAALGASRLRPPVAAAPTVRPSDATPGGPPPPEPESSADDVEAGRRKEPVDMDLPPWQRGRYGTAVGRAVHAVLQAADFTSATSGGSDALTALARAQAAAEGVHTRADVVEQLARSALSAPTVRAAAGAPHWRELFLATGVGDVVLEGYVDLLVRTPAGLVVVDYKTDATPDDDALAERTLAYREQLAAYGVLVEAVLGEPVVDARLVFCRPGGAAEVSVPSWPAAIADVRERLARGEPTASTAPSPSPVR